MAAQAVKMRVPRTLRNQKRRLCQRGPCFLAAFTLGACTFGSRQPSPDSHDIRDDDDDDDGDDDGGGGDEKRVRTTMKIMTRTIAMMLAV